MKSINLCSDLLGFCLHMLIGFVATGVQAREYYIYRDPEGILVISNQKSTPRRSRPALTKAKLAASHL